MGTTRLLTVHYLGMRAVYLIAGDHYLRLCLDMLAS